MPESPFEANGPEEHPHQRYQENRNREAFRNFGEGVTPVVREVYRLNHTHQTVEFNRAQRTKWLNLDHARMGIWQLMEELNQLVDDSDPDTDLTQIEHNLQTAEAIRSDGHPRWFQLTGLIHDLGKVLWLWGEPQWAVVGDTFPVGCAWSDRIVFKEFFAENPDGKVSEYQTRLGIYRENCGLDNVMISWGHDEYLYHVVRKYLPVEALYMIRYHSFYPWHHEGDYSYLMNDQDRRMREWVRKFNPYDLYSKGLTKPDLVALKPYYQELVAEFFPDTLSW